MRRSAPRWLLACGVAAAVSFAGAALLLTREFHAELTLEYRPASGELSESSWQELLATEAVILQSRTVCARAAPRIGTAFGPRSSPDAIKSQACDRIEVERLPKTRILRVKAQQSDREQAISLVEAIAEAYLSRRREQDPEAKRYVQARISELEGRSDELAELEYQVQAYARERGLLTYDTEVAVGEIELIRQEIVRLRIRKIHQEAELKQLEQAVESRSYAAPRLAQDAEFRAEKARATGGEPVGGGQASAAGDAGVTQLPRGASPTRAHELAQTILANARAELAVLDAQLRELADLVVSEEDQLAGRAHDLVELRKRERILEERKAIRDTVLRWDPETAARQAAPLFAVGVLDHARIVGRYPPRTAWLVVLLSLAALGGGIALWRARTSQGIAD